MNTVDCKKNLIGTTVLVTAPGSAQRASEYEAAVGSGPSTANLKFDSPNKAKIGKSLRDMEKVLSGQGKGTWPNNSVSALERALGEINRALEKGHDADKHGFHCLGGFAILSRCVAS